VEGSIIMKKLIVILNSVKYKYVINIKINFISINLHLDFW